MRPVEHKYTVKVRWIETATPDELVNELIDRLSNATVDEKVDMLNAFHKRAEVEGGDVCRVFNAFTDNVACAAAVSCGEAAQKRGQVALAAGYEKLRANTSS
jgi:hypothetical protein